MGKQCVRGPGGGRPRRCRKMEMIVAKKGCNDMAGEIIYFGINRHRVFSQDILDQTAIDHDGIGVRVRVSTADHPVTPDKYSLVMPFHVLSIVPQPLLIPSL